MAIKRKNRPGFMLMGSPPRWRKVAQEVTVNEPRVPTPFTTTLTGHGHVEPPALPVVRIERGSGGDVRYSVSIPAMTPDAARLEAMRQFQLIREGLKEVMA